MRRHTVRPFGQSIPASRLLSLLIALVVLWMLYTRLGDPATWRFVGYSDDVEPVKVTAAKVATPSEPAELLVPGPNDLDPDEVADFQHKLELVANEQKLLPREMLLYWQLMEWACTQKMRDLEKRALKDVVFRQIWEEPEKYQGKLIRLRIHAQQTVRFETPTKKDGEPTNSLGLKEVFEVWGPTDDAVPFHYVVICPEKPEALKLGPKAEGEIVFVGYFLKLMRYDARDGNKRGAPLLIGRMRMANAGIATKAPSSNETIYFSLAIVGLLLTAGLYALTTFRRRHRPEPQPLPANLPDLSFGEDPGELSTGVVLPGAKSEAPEPEPATVAVAVQDKTESGD